MIERTSALPAKHSALVALAIAALFAALGFVPLWQQLELKGFDVLTVAGARGSSSLPITIVAIDEASFVQIGRQWPWPRSLHAKLVDQLTKAGALVIAFDVLLSEVSMVGPADDAALAQAISRSANVVIASDRVYQESAHARQWIRVDPLPEFKRAGATNGLALVSLDPDLVVRRLPEGDDVLWRAILRRVNEQRPGLVNFDEPERGAMIRHVGPDRTFPYVSYYQALDADTSLPPDAFRDQIVLIGRDLKASTDQGSAQSDLFATPFTSRTGWLTPGVEIHANILESVIRGDSVTRAPALWNMILVTVAVFAATWAMRRWRPLVSALFALSIMVVIAALDWFLFARTNVWLPVLNAMSGAIAVYLVLGGMAYVGEQRRRTEIRRAFSLYVSPEVVDHVLANPERLVLGGERREVTMFFTDLEGFTPLTERLGAVQVARILNLHFSRATAIIKRNSGTVNRFIGDAIMAMWGAPLDDPRQSVNACRAACEIQEDLKLLRQELIQQGLPEIRMRVGIHTCVAVVGNLGSSDRFDYTAIGDGVNLAARLEGVNKLYRTEIVVSSETVAKLNGELSMRLVDRVIVKGKTEPVEIFTPCRDSWLIELSDRAIAAYRARHWEESELLWREILKRDPDDGIAAVYQERIARSRIHAPDANWKGEIELEKL
ncbi:MAG TPA: adenylate/guanylate cyclase domain-containing protein [Usitatibacter sp.]|nr:adenylate/guanylate cyclase domain-containing protein [Usitatibacter sp.]